MNTRFYRLLTLSMMVAFLGQGTHAAAMKKTVKSAPAPLTLEKQLSPIEKALSQQKRERGNKKATVGNDQIKVMTSIKTAPTQNFLAEQNQRFSRLVQSIFPQQSS